MQFVKYFNCVVVFVSLLVLPQIAISSVVEGKCGEYIFQVMISNGHDLYERQFTLYYKGKGQKKELFYKTKSVVYLDAACIKNKKEQDLMLFLVSYGGNAGPEDIYGIFDPSAAIPHPSQHFS